jgi:Winged helix DNA-binding domain
MSRMSTSPRLIDDSERRARLARRHAIAAPYRVANAEAATRAMTVLHSTEPATPYLSVQARVDGGTRADLDRALYDDRTLVKQLAMRRTLFVFPRDLLPAAWGSASSRVAGQIGARLVKELEQHAVAEDGAAWLETARQAVLDRLADGSALNAVQLREQLPELEGRVQISPGKKYGGQFPVAPRVLTQLAVEAKLTRGRNGGHWRVSKPMWTRMDSWLGEQPEPLPAAEGFAELIRRYLRTFGPATETDIVWWLGATKGIVRTALATLDAVEVRLERDGIGWVLPDDVDPEPAVEPWAALLPVLDPTTMGWKQREFYLAPDYVPYLFDTAGNGGTTAWWNGRIVGAYTQHDDGRIEVLYRSDPGPAARAALEREAERLTSWMDGEVVNSIYKSQLMKGIPLP